jgi:hypothetical protein
MTSNAVFADTCPICFGDGVENAKTCGFCEGEGYLPSESGLVYHVPKNPALFMNAEGRLINSVDDHYAAEARKVSEARDRAAKDGLYAIVVHGLSNISGPACPELYYAEIADNPNRFFPHPLDASRYRLGEVQPKVDELNHRFGPTMNCRFMMISFTTNLGFPTGVRPWEEFARDRLAAIREQMAEAPAPVPVDILTALSEIAERKVPLRHSYDRLCEVWNQLIAWQSASHFWFEFADYSAAA